jgi:hypothetical protein
MTDILLAVLFGVGMVAAAGALGVLAYRLSPGGRATRRQIRETRAEIARLEGEIAAVQAAREALRAKREGL